MEMSHVEIMIGVSGDYDKYISHVKQIDPPADIFDT